eukprot:scaffold399559_cov33-Prasinocladus_malaysianus.AAC.4
MVSERPLVKRFKSCADSHYSLTSLTKVVSRRALCVLQRWFSLSAMIAFIDGCVGSQTEYPIFCLTVFLQDPYEFLADFIKANKPK